MKLICLTEMVKVAWPPLQHKPGHSTSQSTRESSVNRHYEYSSESYERKSESIERETISKQNDEPHDQHRYLLEQKMQQLREQELQQQHREAARARSQQRDLPPVPPPRNAEVVRAEPAIVREEPRVREIPVQVLERSNSQENQAYIVQEPTSEASSANTVNNEPITFKSSANAVEVSFFFVSLRKTTGKGREERSEREKHRVNDANDAIFVSLEISRRINCPETSSPARNRRKQKIQVKQNELP